MRPHPKIRKTVKWGGAAASVLLAVVWIASCRWGARIDYGDHRVQVTNGQATLHFKRWRTTLYAPPLKSSAWDRVGELGWSGHWAHLGSDWWLTVPLWLPFALIAGPTVWLWWPDLRTVRRRRAGQCIKCGYDRAGIAAGAVCPECGAGSGKEELNAEGAEGAKKSGEDSGT